MTNPAPPEGIAIIGLAGRFPGARDAREFWRNLAEGRDCITRFSDDQLAKAGYDPQALRALPGYVAARGVLDEPEWFDRTFFGIPPKEAEVMDPQHRVFLEVAWEALEDAACDPSRYAGLIGVFAGMSNNTYFPFFVRQRRDLLEAVGIVSAIIANEKDFLTTRLAYKLNLRGPALNIQTACSSSLVSVCVACQNLLDHQCDVALAGGISLTFPQHRGYFYQDGSMTSPDGSCRPFDARANGTVFSSGAGVVVLKRLADALEDRDHIYAVIKGHALNNDGGQKVGFAAPSVRGHSEVIALAQAVAGVPPRTISYLEAHGTATPLGDPVEIAGLTHVFREDTDARQFCALGSVKGNIGHCDAASGIASLIKTALAFEHGQLPPTLHCEQPNPALHLEDSPFFLNTTLRSWPRGQEPRRAGVSSFGVGGTNAHVVLEEAPPPLVPATADDSPQLIVLSAKSPAALERRAQDLAKHLEQHPASDLADVAFTLQTGRQTFTHRRALVARTAPEAIAALRAPAKLQHAEDRNDTPIAFLFPGQGAQYPGMGARLYACEPAFREALAQCAEVLRPDLELDLCELLFSREADAEAKLHETRYTQPAIFAVSYALARLWLARGFRPAALLGHSVGEFVAGAVAGVLEIEDAARLVALRARLTQELPRGAMLAARVNEDEASQFLGDPRLALAAVNSPKLSVFSGPFEAIESLEIQLGAQSIAARRLATSHAFHSPMVEAVVPLLAEALRGVALRPPQIPIVSSVTGDWLSPAQATDPQYWARHLRATVRFSDAIAALLAAGGFALLEVGPGQTLSQLARQSHARTGQHEIVHSIAEEIDESESLATAEARLWLAGVPLDWPAIHVGERRRVPLPAYPFERERIFADLPAGEPMPIATAATDGEAPPEAESARNLPAPIAAPVSRDVSAFTTSSETAPADSALARVKQVLVDLSGLDLAGTPGGTSLLDLGFDSLFLSQAALTLSRKFGVRITVRQLLGDLGTLDALASHLAAEAPQPVPAAEPASAPAHSLPTTVEPPAAHGPFRPVQRELGSALTTRQQRWLDDFIARYTARTGASKRHIQEHRGHFADPRAISGFKQLWKEMVYPIVADRSSGASLWDIDGNEWLDVTLSYGAAMFGHQPPFVVQAIREQLDRGFEIGPTSPLAGEVAALLCALTGMDRATFCNTGSEAVTGALRAARTVTGRAKIAYFRGSYHGIDNEVLGRRAGHAILPIAPGIPPAALADALILDYGEAGALEAIAAQAGELAAVLVEPVQSRHPALQPREFLHELRALTERHGIALIFDEIISGFRCHPGGAQAHFGVRADLATYGKVIGGGLPIGAIAGRAAFMDAFDGGAWSFGDDSFPAAAVTFFAGTFVRHPLALAAARAVLTHLAHRGPALQEALSASAERTIARINAALSGTPFSAARFASNWLVQIAPEFKYSGLLFALLRQRGIHIWENRPCFISTAHCEADLDRVVAAFAESAAELDEAGFISRPTAGARAEAGPIATTEAQQEVWLVCQQGPTASQACNETWTLMLDGSLDADALRGAIQAVIDRHESLRSTFSHSGETIAIAPSLALDVPLRDLSSLSDAERGARFAAMRAEEGARSFDLEHGPLLAVQLIRLGMERHALIFNAHHLVCDGWSCDLFLHEMAELYSARREGRPHKLPPAMTLRDYDQFSQTLRNSPEFAADEAYWLSQYRTLPPALTLPGDHPYPKQRSFRGASEVLLLPPEFAQALTRLGAQSGVTLFSVLLAGFKALIFGRSGQGDLAVGVPSAGQNLIGGDVHLIGHCVNMLPVRSQLDREQRFSQLLKAVQATVLDAFEHQRVTFGSLLRKLSFSRDPGRIPLIPVTFNVDPPLSHIHFSGLHHRLEANPRRAFQFDLGFNCDNTPDGFRLICHYNTDLFDAATIQQWLADYCALLEKAAADPDQPLDALLSKGSQPATAPRPQASVELWPSSPTAGDDPVYDDVLYNAMTLDKSRHNCYRRALASRVRDKVIADIGTGRDALLARTCIEAGARKVYAIEMLERPARQARDLVERLGLAEKIIVIEGRSRDVQLPEPVDVCLSENVGHIGGAEGCDLILEDARQRFLKPGGLVIPGRCETRIAAVSLPEAFLGSPAFEPLGAYYAGQIWHRAQYRHDFRLCITGMSRDFLRSTDDVFEAIDFTREPAAGYERAVLLTIARDSRIDGFLLWLKLETVPGETLEAIDHHDSWLPVYLPAFYPPIEVSAGDRIEAIVRGELAANGLNRDYHIAGRVRRQRRNDAEFNFDSWHYKQVYRNTPFYDHLFRKDVIPFAGRNQVPAEWNGAERPFPGDKGVGRLFEEQAVRTPGAIAIEDGDRRLTYGELDQRANRLARHLLTAGVEPGACVGICMERSIELIAGILAILKSGGAYVPLDPSYPAERLSLMLNDTHAPIVLAMRNCAARLPRTASRIIEIESLDLTQGEATNPGHPRAGDDLAYVMFTSGSTGKPKGSAILHRGISRLVINTDYVQFAPDDAVAHVSNIAFDASTFEIWGALLNGARLVIIPREDVLAPRALAESLRRTGVTSLFVTTPLFHQIAREFPEAFGSLRHLVTGGDALEPGAARAVLNSARPPANFINGYGPTETTTFAICHRVTGISADARTVPIGRPIANTRVYLLDPERRPVAVGEQGEIYIGGPGVAHGYVNRPELTASSFVPDPFSPDGTARLYKTGDLARWLPDGTIDFIGRIDDQVKVRGFRVEPGEIESALRQHPRISDCKVIAWKNGAASKVLAAYVAPRSGALLGADDVRDFLQRRLPEFMVPSSLTVLDTLPLNANGKLDLEALPKPAAAPAPAAPVDDPPTTPIEQGIAALWEEVLGRNHFSRHDDFFLVGGHSLLAIRLIGRLRERYAVDVPVQRLFEKPTIEGLAEFVSAHLPAASLHKPESLVMIQRGDAQRRPLFLVPGGWGGELEFLVYAELVRHMDRSLPLYGLRARRSNTEPLPDKTVEELAAGFVADLCAVQPVGPYFIGGECVGGIVAYEMARQLEGAGKKVALLILLDTDWPSPDGLDQFEDWERKRRDGEAATVHSHRSLAHHWRQMRSLSPRGKLRYLRQRLRPGAAERDLGAFIAERQLLTAYPRKLMTHVPRPHGGKVTLLQDAEANRQLGNAGWDRHHPGELEVHIVPGDHTSYIRQHAADTAAKIREIIDRASDTIPC